MESVTRSGGGRDESVELVSEEDSDVVDATPRFSSRRGSPTALCEEAVEVVEVWAGDWMEEALCSGIWPKTMSVALDSTGASLDDMFEVVDVVEVDIDTGSEVEADVGMDVDVDVDEEAEDNDCEEGNAGVGELGSRELVETGAFSSTAGLVLGVEPERRLVIVAFTSVKDTTKWPAGAAASAASSSSSVERCLL